MSDPIYIDYGTPPRHPLFQRLALQAGRLSVGIGFYALLVPLLPIALLATAPVGTSMRPMLPWAVVLLCAVVALLLAVPLGLICRIVGRRDATLRRLGNNGVAGGLAATTFGIVLFHLVVYWRHFRLEP